MLKKLLLLTVALASFNVCNASKTDFDDTRNDRVNKAISNITDDLGVIIAHNYQQTKALLGHEVKPTAVAMACHTVTLLWAHKATKNMYQSERMLVGVPVLFMSIFVGNKLTNVFHEYMDDKKHKTAQFAGFTGAFSLVEFLARRNLI